MSRTVVMRSALCCCLLCWLGAGPVAQRVVASTPPAPAAARSSATSGASTDWTLLPIDVIGARSFRAAHPGWDGRGAVIAILDSGVDLDVPGLTELPGGGRKILDARDFSGQGDVALTRAEPDTADGRPCLKDADGRRVFGVDKLPLAAADSMYWLGFLKEESYRNSAVPDLNNNGRKDDRFAVLAFAPVRNAADSAWAAIVDLDGDGQLDDETPLRSYGVSGNLVRFRSSTDKDKLQLLTGGLTILPREHKVEFHLADGPHGTHVAGIAAGYRLDGQDGLDGVAPGARLLSLKIGNNTLTGGASTTGSMKKAMEWVAQWAEEKHLPVALNMSYGIGSELEGRSDIDRFIDDYMLEHPDIVYVCSNGNEGPGLSSTGTPAAARFAFSTGNLLSVTGSRDQFGGGARRDLLFYSSSRGGELAKPDAVAPGTALSSVPPYDAGEIKVGTSMASPQATGAMALLITAARAEGIPYTWATLHQAVKGTAWPLAGFTPLDYGGGVIQVELAWRALRELGGRVDGPLLSYRIEATNPFFPDGRGPALFWRNNGWFPRPPRTAAVTLKPAFRKAASPEERNRFFRAFDLVSDVSWIKIDRKNTYIKGDDATTFRVEYVPASLVDPGLYFGRVLAYAKGMSGPRLPEWELWNTVIIPWRFDAEAGYSREWSGAWLEPGGVRRTFLEVPPGTTSMELVLEALPGSLGQVRLIVHDPEGHTASEFQGYASTDKQKKDVHVFWGDRLRPGTWEADVYATYLNQVNSAWRLEAVMSGLRAEPDTVRRVAAQPGESPTAQLTVTNQFADAFEGTAAGRILGYRRDRILTAHDQDVWEMPFKFGADIDSASFRVEFSDSLYNRLTDCVVSVLDSTGRALVREGMEQRTHTVMVRRPATAGKAPIPCTFQIWAGFAYESSKTAWTFRLEESYFRHEPETISVAAESGAALLLVPGAPVELNLSLSAAPRVPPAGTFNFGRVEFRDAARGRIRLVVPVRLD